MDPPEQIAQLAVGALPALVASFYSAAGAVCGAIPVTRRIALADSLEGGPRASMERYLEHGEAIETRWLLLRVLGVTGSAALLLSMRSSPSTLATMAIVLVAYALPSQIIIALARPKAERAAPALLSWLRPLEWMAAPLAAPLLWIGRLAGGPLRVGQQPATTGLTETEVELLVNEGELNGSLDHDQSEMIRNVLDFGDMQAGDIMLPRMHVSGLSIDTDINEVLKLAAQMGYSRYPVYRDRIDNVVGFLHVKDLVTRAANGELEGLSVADIMRTPVVYVPETQSASSVLADMRSGNKHHIAIVIDEFGGMAGIITLEDIIEKIVGDIRDEHDDPAKAPPLVDLSEGRVLADARVTMAELSRHLGVDLPEDGDYYSLGGFVVEALGQVPRPGTKLVRFGFEFIVKEADERHVTQLEIRRDPENDQDSSPQRHSSRPSRPRPAA